MRRILAFIVVSFSLAALCTSSCKHKPQLQLATIDGDYPDSVAKIILNKCTNAGCHNQASYLQPGAPGLLLDTWEHMFQGDNFGTQVVPYNAQYSPLLYQCNYAFDAAEIDNYDTNHFKPYIPITAKEYATLKNWILKGAPDIYGNIPFATNPDTRQKIYLTVSACNLIAVIDAKSKQVMRYIPVGIYPGNQSLHDVTFSSDGLYAYISFINDSLINTTNVQKIDVRTDTVVNSANLSSAALGGNGAWGIIILSPDNLSLMVSGFTSPGYIVNVNTTTMAINPKLSIDLQTGGTDKFIDPHGLASNAAFDTFYATLEYGNIVNKFWFTPTRTYIVPVAIQGHTPRYTSDSTTPDPHQIQMSPDYSKYFVTCQTQTLDSSAVRVMDTKTDTLIKVIRVGGKPQEMAISQSKNYLFVVCMEDNNNPLTNALGSVYVIDYNTLDVVTVLYGTFYQPHDIAVDEQDGLLFIVSTNYSGPAPHHVTSPCGGNNGWYNVYDLNTLLPDNKVYFVPAFPYAISNRF